MCVFPTGTSENKTDPEATPIQEDLRSEWKRKPLFDKKQTRNTMVNKIPRSSSNYKGDVRLGVNLPNTSIDFCTSISLQLSTIFIIRSTYQLH